MNILRIGKNMIHIGELSSIVRRFSIEYHICKSMEPPGEFRHISMAKIKNIPRRGMTIVDFLCICSDTRDCIETIPWEYHNIVLVQEFGLIEKSRLEDCMSESFHEDGTPEWDHLACESQLSRIKTPLGEKPRYEICTEYLSHEGHESLSTTTVEEGIMEDGDLRFFISHEKRILNIEKIAIYL